MPDDTPAGSSSPAAPDSRFLSRAYQAGDEAAILDLFATSFHVRRSIEHWRWKFEDDPFGDRHISETFDAAGKLIGHYAGYVVPLRDGDRDLLVHQVGDTMTDAAVRHIGRGPSSILGRTAAHFYRTFCDERVAFNYGFNVSNIQRFSLRFLRSDLVEPVPYRVRDLRRDPIIRIAKAARWMRGYQLELLTSVSAELDRFFERVAPAYGGFLVRRDARYLRWRYLDCPDVIYFVIAIRKWRRLCGWSVFRVRGNRLSWGDALFDPAHADAIEVMLRHVVPGYPVDEVEAWFPERPEWFDVELRRLRFESRQEPQDLSLMCVPFVRTDAAERMREAFYYTMGDSDLF